MTRSSRSSPTRHRWTCPRPQRAGVARTTCRARRPGVPGEPAAVVCPPACAAATHPSKPRPRAVTADVPPAELVEPDEDAPAPAPPATIGAAADGGDSAEGAGGPIYASPSVRRVAANWASSSPAGRVRAATGGSRPRTCRAWPRAPRLLQRRRQRRRGARLRRTASCRSLPGQASTSSSTGRWSG